MAPSTPEVPQPTHGGVYELVDGKLRVIEGGPPNQQPAAAAETPAPQFNAEATGEGA